MGKQSRHTSNRGYECTFLFAVCGRVVLVLYLALIAKEVASERLIGPSFGPRAFIGPEVSSIAYAHSPNYIAEIELSTTYTRREAMKVDVHLAISEYVHPRTLSHGHRVFSEDITFGAYQPQVHTSYVKFNVSVSTVYQLDAEMGNGAGVTDTMYLTVGSNGEMKIEHPSVFITREKLLVIQQQKPRLAPTPTNLDRPMITLDVAVQVYYSYNGEHGFPFARIDIYEEDIFGLEFLGSRTLDQRGYWSGPLETNFEIGHYELLVDIFFANKYITMRMGFEEPSRDIVIRTPTQSFPGDIFIWIGYTIPFSEEVGVYISYCSIGSYTATLRDIPSSVVVWFPATTETTFFQREPSIYIGVPRMFWKSTMALAHEYGHWLMYVMFRGRWPGPYAPGPHAYCPEALLPQPYAWAEGYASAFSIFATGSVGSYCFKDEECKDIERYDCPHNTNLEGDEFRIAAALYDLYDSAYDDNAGNMFRGRNRPLCDNKGSYTLTAKQLLIEPLAVAVLNSVTDYIAALRRIVITSPEQDMKSVQLLQYNWATVIPPPEITLFSIQCKSPTKDCTDGAGEITFDLVWASPDDRICNVQKRRVGGGSWKMLLEGAGAQGSIEETVYEPMEYVLGCQGHTNGKRSLRVPMGEDYSSSSSSSSSSSNPL